MCGVGAGKGLYCAKVLLGVERGAEWGRGPRPHSGGSSTSSAGRTTGSRSALMSFFTKVFGMYALSV